MQSKEKKKFVCIVGIFSQPIHLNSICKIFETNFVASVERRRDKQHLQHTHS